MCGIIGYIGDRDAPGVLIDGLKRLEYRGYDSAGIAVLNSHGIEIERAQGKLSKLEAKLKKVHPHGHVGIGHTRWATHGVPAERNAHPHRVGDVVVVHNGIIENYAELRSQLIKKGCKFLSETDTEVFCHLISEELKKEPSSKRHSGGSRNPVLDPDLRRDDDTIRNDKSVIFEQAIRRALLKVRGTYALVVLYAKEPDKLFVSRLGSPLVLGIGKHENLVASDVPALLPYTRDVIFLEDGDVAVLSKNSFQIRNEKGASITKQSNHIDWNPLMAEKGGFKHFMLKEIFEQPRVVHDTLMGRIQPDSGKIVLPDLDKLIGKRRFPFEKIEIIACGTSYHAGLVAKYWFEMMARIPTTVSLASEFRYADPIVNAKTLVISISQSGETADTLAATSLAKKNKAKVLAICNVLGSSLARSAAATVYTHAGPEIGVASTKAFVSQLTVLYLLALEFAKRRGEISTKELVAKLTDLRRVPQYLEKILKDSKHIKKVAQDCVNASHFLFIARGCNYPLALEGALKLKEISYVHAEGFAAGELKHGPIALVEKGVPVVALIPHGETYEKILSNVQEVKARGAYVIAVAESGDRHVQSEAKAVISIPRTEDSLTPLLYAIPLQLFAYYIADEKGCDVDQPRNLAKSVTVE